MTFDRREKFSKNIILGISIQRYRHKISHSEVNAVAVEPFKKGLTNGRRSANIGLEGLGTLDGLNSPRFKGDMNVKGLLDVSVDDITLNVPNAVKQNVLKACNECAMMGYTNGREYATLLDARTGEVVKGCRLKEGTADTVSVADWVGLFDSAESRSLALVHNHPNGSVFSFEDVSVLVKYDALGSLLLASDRHLYYMGKERNATLDFELIEEAFKAKGKKRADFEVDGELVDDMFYDFFKKFWNEVGFRLERW